MEQRNYRGLCLDRYFLQETTDLIIMLKLPRPVLAKSGILYQTEKKSLACDSSSTANDFFFFFFFSFDVANIDANIDADRLR